MEVQSLNCQEYFELQDPYTIFGFALEAGGFRWGTGLCRCVGQNYPCTATHESETQRLSLTEARGGLEWGLAGEDHFSTKEEGAGNVDEFA